MPDTDKDGLSDAQERRLGTDPNDEDSDNDGLSDYAETRLKTDPLDHNTDGDAYRDGSEVGQHFDPRLRDPAPKYGGAEGRRQPTADDPDADGLPTMAEEAMGTDPGDPDSDNDGLGDFVEFVRGTNPLSKYSDGKGDTTTDLQDVERELAKPHQPGQRIAAADDGGAAGAATATVTALRDDFADDEDTSGSSSTVDDSADLDVDPTADPRGPSAAKAEQQRTAFLEAAKAQIGDKYRFGAETDLTDSDPTAFDSSELVQWAAAQAGVEVPDGSWKQYQFLHEKGATMSVDDALHTPGALVFGFSSDPLASNDRPTRAYVAISLGDGTVLDVSERAGEVRVMEPGNFFTHAAYVPGMAEDIDSDGDGMIDIDERVLGLNPNDPTDFGPQPAKVDPPDTDGDGMPDVDEEVLGLDPNDPSDGPKSWGSGSSTPAPAPAKVEPPDTDGDGMPDVDEEVLGLDPNDPSDGPKSWGNGSSTTTPDADVPDADVPDADATDAGAEYEPDSTYPTDDGLGGDDLTDGYESDLYAGSATDGYGATGDDDDAGAGADVDTFEDDTGYDA